MKRWWEKHWETATVALCASAGLIVIIVAVWTWVADMGGVP